MFLIGLTPGLVIPNKHKLVTSDYILRRAILRRAFLRRAFFVRIGYPECHRSLYIYIYVYMV